MTVFKGKHETYCGTIEVPANATSLVVYHNLTDTPKVVLVSPTSAPGTTFWVDTRTSETFTIHLAAGQSGIVTFDFYASLHRF